MGANVFTHLVAFPRILTILLKRTQRVTELKEEGWERDIEGERRRERERERDK